ncbi:MAG: hypothetical protein AAFP69_20760 [Planctomycetota bacterium]
MTLITGRINVLVLGRMVNIDRNIHAGQFASPEEVSVILDFEFLIPADRLQNVSIVNKAIAA